MSERDAYQLQEHWEFLVKDEKQYPPISDEIRNDPDVSKMRKYLIEFILQVGDRLKQRALTMQIAVNYLDRLFMMGKLDLVKKDKHLWAVTALLLASKYDELDQNIPYIKEFGKVSSKAKYTYSEVIKCETEFLNLLKWDLISICPSYFLSVILHLCNSESSNTTVKSQKVSPPLSFEKMKQLNKFSEFFMDIAFQSLELQKYQFSVQAVSAVTSARKVLGLKPLWSKDIENFTKIKLIDCKECFEKLFSKYEKHFPKKKLKHQKKEKENLNFLETKSKAKKRIITGSNNLRNLEKVDKLHSLSRIVVSKHKTKNLKKNSSQPAIGKFCQRKASYIAYMKGSKIQVNLNNDKKITKNGRLSGRSSVSSATHFAKKRTSADCNIRSRGKIIGSAITTPSNAVVNKISRNARTRKLLRNSSSREISSNQNKITRLKMDSTKGGYSAMEYTYRTTKAKFSRNRSVSAKLKQFSNTIKASSTLRNQPKRKVISKKPQNNPCSILNSKDLNLIHVTMDASDLNDCNFTMTDESESCSNLLSHRPRKLKLISNI
ncbi:unnamed protein product [Moneuplotes crassus]|uniref:Cyclin-like domain-containing protein n=1 Tax=Euplotes crassus TaxID=5936 RepID=A0AAD1U9M0_EUPCR|nr:unnamed protein product [Moneuplotes crassus]